MSSQPDFLHPNKGETQRGSTQPDPLDGLEFLRPIQVANKLGLSCAGITSLLRRGKLPGVKIDGAWLIHRSSLRAYLRALVAHKNQMIKLRTGFDLDDSKAADAAPR